MSPRVVGSRIFVRLAGPVAALLLVAACSPQPSVDEIRSFQQVGRFAETIEPLRTRLAEAPDDPELNHLYGVALLQTGQAALAIWPLRKSAQDPGREIDDGLLLMQAILAGGSAEDAVAVGAGLRELAPDRVEVLRLLINARMRARQNEQALEDVASLLELEPDDPGAMISRLVALLSLDRAEEAEQALEALGEAAKRLEGGYEWEPRICGGTATFLKEKGDLEAAENLWNECLEQFPAEEMIVFSGVEFFNEIGNPARASEVLRRAYETEPTHLPFVDAYANRLALAGQSEEAERILLAATEDGFNDRRAWFTLSDYYERRDEFDRAAEAMQNGLALMGDVPPLIAAEYVDLLIRAGRYAEAEALLPSFQNEVMISNLLRGRLLLARGQPRQALDAFQEGIRVWPDNSVARWLAARAHEQLGDYDLAVREYAEALRSDPGDRDALASLLRLLEMLGRDAEALVVVERYWREQPGDPEGLLHVVRIAGRAGRRRLLDQATKELGVIPSYRGRLVAELAALQASRSGPAAGAEYIRNARLDLGHPVHEAALTALVEYLAAQGSHGAALRAADAAVAAAPEEPRFHEIRASALRGAGERELAREAFERALSLEPERPTALAGLAALAAERGDVAEAIALYDRADAASGYGRADHGDPERSRYAWQAIRLVAASGGEAEVERRLEALLVRDGAHAAALELRARQLQARDPERALSLARRAARLRAGPEALDLLGRIQLERGDAEQAAESFRRYVASRPDEPSGHYWLGVALAAAGDVEGARSELAAALEAESFPEREDAQAQLARLRGE